MAEWGLARSDGRRGDRVSALPAAGAPLAGESLPVDQLVGLYLDHRLSQRTLSISSARNHRSHLAVFAAVVAGTPASALRVEHIERWMASRAKLRPASRRGQFSTVKTFCGWLVRAGYLVANPALELASPRTPRTVCRAQGGDAIGALLDVLPDARAGAITWLMLGMGLRCCEVHNLEIGDWDRRARSMVLRGKGGNERVVAVTTETASAVEAYLAEFPTGAGPLIRSYRRPSQALTSDTISGMVSEWMNLAGIKRAARDGVSAHALRATAAVDVFEASNDLTMVQEILGHQNLNTTQIYLNRPNLTKMHVAMAGRSYRSRPSPKPPTQPTLFEV
jgi:site-specific recombinase XerC